VQQRVERAPAAPDTTTVLRAATTPSPGDPLALTLTARSPQKLATLTKKGASARLGCTKQCLYKVALTLKRRTAKRLGLARGAAADVAVGSASGTLRSASTIQVTIKLTRKARRAFAGVRAVTLKLAGTAVAAGSPPARRSVAVVFKR
jgi:hypothetical protein